MLAALQLGLSAPLRAGHADLQVRIAAVSAEIEAQPADPELYIKTRHGQFWAEAVTLEGEERARIWPLLIADRSYYHDYQQLTERQLPVIRLVRKRPADGLPAD